MPEARAASDRSRLPRPRPGLCGGCKAYEYPSLPKMVIEGRGKAEVATAVNVPSENERAAIDKDIRTIHDVLIGLSTGVAGGIRGRWAVDIVVEVAGNRAGCNRAAVAGVDANTVRIGVGGFSVGW